MTHKAFFKQGLIALAVVCVIIGMGNSGYAGGLQKVSLSPDIMSINGGEDFSIIVEYDVSDNNDSLTGLGIRFHFNSNMLLFKDLTDVYQTGYMGTDSQVQGQADSKDYDNNPETDRFIRIAWADANMNWPGYLPVTLARLNFTAKIVNGTTPINISFISTAAGYAGNAVNADVNVHYSFCKLYDDKAIIVAGYSFDKRDRNGIQALANTAYHNALKRQGYSDDLISYMSFDLYTDFNGDGRSDGIVDNYATRDNLRKAITEWAEGARNLLIYIVGHGGKGCFDISKDELLQAVELKSWLDICQPSLSGKIVVIYEACYSGSFIDVLKGYNRIILTSSSPYVRALISYEGSISFSSYFFNRMSIGYRFYDAYTNARQGIGENSTQEPCLDVDGNGTPNEQSDTLAAAQIKVGCEEIYLSAPPSIGEASVSPEVLTNSTLSLIRADKIKDENGIYRVFAVITPPDILYESGNDMATDVPVVELTQVNDGGYEANYTGFTEQGEYRIAIFAQDKEGVLSVPIERKITQMRSPKLAADFGSWGLYTYDGSSWQKIGENPENIAEWLNKLVIDYGSNGLKIYDGSYWQTIGANPESMTAWGDRLAADFGSQGLHVYDGNSWSRIAGNPEAITAWGSKLAADFGSSGLYLFDGNNWNCIAGNPENITPWADRFAADFGPWGLYAYDGRSWQWIGGNPENITSWKDKLAADFGIWGLYLFDGNKWTWIAGNPENITAWGDKLAADFGSWGIYVFDGNNWQWIGGNPEAMAAVSLSGTGSSACH